MSINLHEKSMQLLQKIANSVHERSPENPNLLFFNVHEIKLVEEWLKEFVDEII